MEELECSYVLLYFPLRSNRTRPEMSSLVATAPSYLSRGLGRASLPGYLSRALAKPSAQINQLLCMDF